MLVMIPVYLYKYGPSNFLYFCDVALLLTLVGVWINSPLLISMSAVGIIAPQVFWVLDFIANGIGLGSTGLTDYMFNDKSSKFLRSLSLFHGWLPFYLIYLVYKMGYDPQAFIDWTVLSWFLILIAFFFLPQPKKDAGLKPVNVNYVWGLSEVEKQKWVPPKIWLMFLLVGLPLIFFLPTHYILSYLVK
jgi:hypothetical protein